MRSLQIFHLLALALKSAGKKANNPKTNVVVAIPRRIPVAISRAAVDRVVVPRTAAQEPDVPTPSLASCKHKRTKYLLT